MNSPEPPRLAAWLVDVATRTSPFGESIAGDLRERFDERARAATRPSDANRWYWRHAISIAIHFAPTNLRSRGASLPSRHPDAAITVLTADLRQAVRALSRRPILTSVMLLTLTLGIGANAAIFGVVRAVVLKALPYPDAARVVALSSTSPTRGYTRGGVSRQDAADWAAQSHAFDALGTYTVLEANASLAGEPQRIKVALATSDVFRALGVAPAIGRVLLPSDDGITSASPIVISHRYWMSALGGDPAAVGHTVSIDGKPATVVGVMPMSFAFPDVATDAWRPFGTTADQTGPRVARWVQAVARLRHGVSLEQARSEMSAISARLAAAYPASNDGIGTLVEPQLAADTSDIRALLFVAWAMAGLVLLIVIANTANLALARASERAGETSMRAALGASRWVLARLFLAESLVLSTVGGALAVLLAGAAMPLLCHLGASVGIPRVDVLSIDAWMIAFAAVVSVVAGIAFGIVPALDASAPNAVRHDGRSVLRRGQQTQAALIVIQVALAAAVVVSAGLLLRSSQRLGRVTLGFAIADRTTFRIAPDWAQYPTRPEAEVLFESVLARVGAAPGVVGVAAVNRLPLTGAWWTTEYEPEGQPATPGHEPSANYRVVTPNYFSVMQIPILKGRAIAAGDRMGTQLVAVVSRTLAERAWPGRDPIGQRINFAPERADAPRYTVIGVAGDVHTRRLADPSSPLAYVSFGQAHYGHFNDWGMDVVVQSSAAPAAIVELVRRELHGLAPTLPVFRARPLSDLVASDLATRRLLLMTLGAFAVTAVILAAVGLYGVIACGVTQRRRELGLRIALGAQSAGVAWSIVRRGLGLTAVGLVAGLSTAAALSRSLSGFLYDVRPMDPVTFAAAAVGLLVVAVVASIVPAWRATHADPMTTLRSN